MPAVLVLLEEGDAADGARVHNAVFAARRRPSAVSQCPREGAAALATRRPAGWCVAALTRAEEPALVLGLSPRALCLRARKVVAIRFSLEEHDTGHPTRLPREDALQGIFEVPPAPLTALGGHASDSAHGMHVVLQTESVSSACEVVAVGAWVATLHATDATERSIRTRCMLVFSTNKVAVARSPESSAGSERDGVEVLRRVEVCAVDGACGKREPADIARARDVCAVCQRKHNLDAMRSKCAGHRDKQLESGWG